MWAIPEAGYIRWPEVWTPINRLLPVLPSRASTAPVPAGYANARHLLNRLADGVNGGGPYPLQALLVAGANPCHDLPDTQSVKSAFARIPFIVSFSSFKRRNCRHGRSAAARPYLSGAL